MEQQIKEKYPELAKMTVSDVLNTKEYKANFKDAVKQYRDFIFMQNIKRNPIERLDEAGFLKDYNLFADEYCACLDKQSTLSRTLRDTVLVIGKNIYVKTIKDIMDKYDKIREIHENEK